MANLQSYKEIINDFNHEAVRDGGMFTKDLSIADDIIIKHLRQLIKPEMKVLEIGCGKGNVIDSLNCDAWAVDASEKMLEYCVIKNKFLANMDELPFPDCEFDTVFMCFVLQQSLNPIETVSEAMRVIKKGGVIMIIDGDKDSAIGKDRENQLAVGTWNTCGKANWISRDNHPDFSASNLADHILLLTRQK